MDSDGDGCADTLEVMDINGDRKVSVGDQTALAKRAAGFPAFTGDPVSDAIYDVNKDGKISVGDQTLMAKNTCQQKPGLIGCPVCPPGVTADESSSVLAQVGLARSLEQLSQEHQTWPESRGRSRWVVATSSESP